MDRAIMVDMGNNLAASTVDPQLTGVKRGRFWVLAVMTLVYTINVADRFLPSILIEPIKAEFHLSDGAVGLLTGAALALCYAAAGIPLGILADRVNRRNMIASTLAAWSILTALCGITQGFWQFLLARIGVGLSEAGATPASQSLLADYFQPTERATAMSIFALGSAVGIGLASIGGGLLEARFGWRGCFVIFALAALPLILFLITIREPQRIPCVSRDSATGSRPRLLETMAFVWRDRTLRHILAGATITTFAGQGLVWWTPTFLVRSHNLSVAEAGVQVGLMNAAGGSIMLLVTSFIVGLLARDETRHLCHFLAFSTLLITLPAIVAYTAHGTGTTLLMLWLFVACTSIYLGPTLALLQNLVQPDMRGVVAAVFLFSANIAGLTLAPVLIGLASDVLARHIADPVDSLRIALALSTSTGFWAAAHFWAATAISRDEHSNETTSTALLSAGDL